MGDGDTAIEGAAAEAAASDEASGDLAAKKKRKKKSSDKAQIAVRLQHVSRRFGAKVAVDDLSLTIEAGSVYGLIGPNGAGKTTTFSMMAGFLKPTSGQVDVLGYAPSQVDELRSRLGVLPQDALLPAADKVGELLLHMARLQDIPADKAEEAVHSVLEEVSGLDWWNTRCGSLSHGMAKRVQLAQAILGDPEVILLDEPTAGLDPRVAYEVRQLVKARKGRATLVISSHNLQELEEICDAAAILDRGKVVAEGTMADLTAATGEIHVKIAPMLQAPAGAYRDLASSVPLAKVRELPVVARAELDSDRSELVVYFERSKIDAETVIGQVLWLLLQEGTRVSGVSKGRSLEQAVMELT